jgi:glucosamine--fructose-6-phosphate aminotransferase (isomerizing)
MNPNQPHQIKPDPPGRFLRIRQFLTSLFNIRVFFGKHPGTVRGAAIILFPCNDLMLACGLTGIVCFKTGTTEPVGDQISSLEKLTRAIDDHGHDLCTERKLTLKEKYLGGDVAVGELVDRGRRLNNIDPFAGIFSDKTLQARLADVSSEIKRIIEAETAVFYRLIGRLPADTADIMSGRIEKLKDTAWGIDRELIGNIDKINGLKGFEPAPVNSPALSVFKQINAALNSIDRLEVRGRDSAGISLLFVIDAGVYANFIKGLNQSGLAETFQQRLNPDILKNRSIRSREPGESKDSKNSEKGKTAAICFTYKVAEEIGRLGDNTAFIRQQIRTDPVLQRVLFLPRLFHTTLIHTRWASVGDINEANCHPMDHMGVNAAAETAGIIHACLNGDIDNFRELKKDHEASGFSIPEEISTDTKIIPVHVASYIRKGLAVEEAFRMAVNDFEGSHAIALHTDLAPGKMFLALRGSGQAIFVGLADDFYMPTSELYGLVEETQAYLKMDGGGSGQIFILDQSSAGGLEGIRALSYDGTPIALSEADRRQTPLTSRDIDRQDFDHYFLKEISESPFSVRKTLENRWKLDSETHQRYVVSLDQTTVPPALQTALNSGAVRRVILIGQGTAGVAAQTCADIMRHHLKTAAMEITAMKSSEFSGFILNQEDNAALDDLLLIPISQSGTTADTNKTVDMARQRGAWAIAIVNRRDSDLTFKTHGVLYTSSGRDIEMSVASTKAFYSQIIAGTLLSLYLAQLLGCRNDAFISHEIKQMNELPGHMETVLAAKDFIRSSAMRHATSRDYWAVVGSGANKTAADEIRIKLSELCYKTISSDFVEDKKHIDLSSEPLIVVCAAGTRGAVIGDIVKDTAIFHSHKALPIVIADEHEDRFAPYAADVIHVPAVDAHFAPILNTLAGHIWGYFAALAINEGSRFLYDFRTDIQQTLQSLSEKGQDIFEIALENSFREKILRFYREFKKRQDEHRLASAMGAKTATDLILLLKYLSGRLPLADFELDFGIKGTAVNIFKKLFEVLGEAINALARPIDAIKHQAKTVTVGTSRIEAKIEGMIFDILAGAGFTLAQLTLANVMVIRNLQNIISEIKGTTLYRVTGINLLGEPTQDAAIEVMAKTGTSAVISSRAEKDRRLAGSKRIIVSRGNVYIGMGRKDGRSIVVIPVISSDAARPNTIEYLMLIEIAFNDQAALDVKVKALGGKYEHIKNLVQETHVAWNDAYLDQIDMKELFGLSAEKLAEKIAAMVGV